MTTDRIMDICALPVVWFVETRTIPKLVKFFLFTPYAICIFPWMAFWCVLSLPFMVWEMLSDAD